MSTKDYLVNGYLPTIGIECHVQFNTKTKLFTGVLNDAKDALPNSLIGPLCVGLPGTLPVLNEAAVEKAIRAGIALNAKIAEFTKFDRKHYFYPDLPLGYQISQFDKPIVLDGEIPIVVNGQKTSVRIERAHLEADAGKLTHPVGKDYSLIDYNRAGTPLLEIVSRPDMHSAAEAKAYAQELYLRMLYAGVSDCDLFHGNIRFDVNVSVSKDPATLGTRTETKNLNSFRNVERAVAFEIERQIDQIEKGQVIVQETRGWDDTKQKTFSQRSKENAHDYRYMPDPDIPPLEIDRKLVEEIAKNMPAGPSEIRQVLSGAGLNHDTIETILDYPEAAKYLLQVADQHDQKTLNTIANWITGEILRLVKENRFDFARLGDSAQNLVKLASMYDASQLSSTAAKELIEPIINDNQDPQSLAEARNLLQVSDESELILAVEQVIAENPKAVADAQADPKAIGFLVGQVMKATGGKANPKVVSDILREHI
ncbi:Asp-tRNA(Asn)/Glu-tRNA(Gln) amidotransferase subunit GatB [Candidatus Saccharibacteria bacterium]|nr:Asp-tRNA(Asn)/Glu-tRNA(Gln) amidotransferase subunit GatB [Candidatus Saccharibacteria bacterium]MCB9821615.1 Asp-tRNA(Asn)/Glu-tRNA(Gln) amidotransferase subunit GatB [Candidatus Nomurabacteria bacterium]